MINKVSLLNKCQGNTPKNAALELEEMLSNTLKFNGTNLFQITLVLGNFYFSSNLLSESLISCALHIPISSCLSFVLNCVLPPKEIISSLWDATWI